eukprot:3281901-Amphidinium_carterae.1
MQETFLLQAKIPGASRMASENGYFSSFVSAWGTAGRPSGGLAILCKQAVPQQRLEDGAHWEAGRRAHYILPYEGGVHVYNVYGYPSTDKQAPEKNREILVEVMGS